MRHPRAYRPLFAAFLLLSVSPALAVEDTANFTYQIGASVPPPQYFYLVSTNPAVQVSGLTVHTSGQSWISASLSSSVTPSTLSISVNPAGLAASFYSGFVQVNDQHTTLDYAVNLTVLSQATKVSVSPAGLTFNVVQGTSVPPSHRSPSPPLRTAPSPPLSPWW
jgi:apolipoprotein N-acyltransferase